MSNTITPGQVYRDLDPRGHGALLIVLEPGKPRWNYANTDQPEPAWKVKSYNTRTRTGDGPTRTIRERRLANHRMYELVLEPTR
ncbi:hypothetical protein [Galactobacter valiniphilus]|uniref:hypothetical protein n=1 Tax=Galactobacter valiniphilus TaxID=2676122 RepID=UPI0037358D8E